jgi:hypothetical protein
MLSEGYAKATPNKSEPEPDCNPPVVYEIRVKSHLDSDWTNWFEGLTITQEESGDTLLTGPVLDQSALHGLLRKVRDLGMSLVSLNQVQPGNARPEMKDQIRSNSEETYESTNRNSD